MSWQQINIQANETMSPEQRHQLAKIEEEKGRCFERISKHNSVVTQGIYQFEINELNRVYQKHHLLL